MGSCRVSLPRSYGGRDLQSVQHDLPVFEGYEFFNLITLRARPTFKSVCPHRSTKTKRTHAISVEEVYFAFEVLYLRLIGLQESAHNHECVCTSLARCQKPVLFVISNHKTPCRSSFPAIPRPPSFPTAQQAGICYLPFPCAAPS